MQARSRAATAGLPGGPYRPVVPPSAEALAQTADALCQLARNLLPLLKPGGATRLPQALAAALLRRASDSTPSPGEAQLAIERAEASLPPVPTQPTAALFHADAIRVAVVAHWAEVRRWELPGDDPERFVAQASEHLRLLDPADLARNPMARRAVRQQVDQTLRGVVRHLDREPLRLLPLLLDGLGFAGGLHDGRLAEALEPQVLAAANVAAVLLAMSEQGEAVCYERGDGRQVFLDPALVDELAQSRLRELALERRLGRQSTPAGPPPAPEVQGEVESFKRRLATLQALFDQGILTAEELAARRAEIIREI